MPSRHAMHAAPGSDSHISMSLQQHPRIRRLETRMRTIVPCLPVPVAPMQARHCRVESGEEPQHISALGGYIANGFQLHA